MPCKSVSKYEQVWTLGQMSQVQLQLGSVNLVVSRAGLQRYPESLLSTMLAPSLAQASDSTGKLLVSVDPQQVPTNPITSWDLAPAIVSALFESNTSPTFWEQILNTTQDSQQVVARKLCELLAYINLPGPVSKWLPPIQDVSMQFPRLLAFHTTCNAMEQAAAAVQNMFQYKPHASAGRPINSAVLLVFAQSSDHILPALETYVVSGPSAIKAITASRCSSRKNSPVCIEDIIRLPDLCTMTEFDLWVATKGRGYEAVGEASAVFGEHVLHAVHALPPDLSIHCKTVMLEREIYSNVVVDALYGWPNGKECPHMPVMGLLNLCLPML